MERKNLFHGRYGTAVYQFVDFDHLERGLGGLHLVLSSDTSRYKVG